MTKIACYGWVKPEGPSLSGASYLLVEQLLELGYVIDFYGNPDHVSESYIPQTGAITYNAATVREFPLRWLGERITKAIAIVRTYWMRSKWNQAYTAAVADAGGPEQYQLLLTLGTPPAFLLPGTPTLSWIQGAPGSEAKAIREMQSTFWRLGIGSIVTYVGLQLYYALSDFRDRRDVEGCARLICGSEWSRQRNLERFQGPVDALPYAMNLDLFKPDPANSEVTRVLWLGRLDPRKRLDLLIDSAPLIQNIFPDVTFTIVGRARYARGQLRLITDLGKECNVEYIPYLDRSRVPHLLSETLVLVQPSMYEDFGTSVAEAVATGVPVVIGPSNGTGDYLDRSATVFDEYTPKSVADAVITCIERRRANFSAVTNETRAEAEVAFSPSTIAIRLAEIIEATRTSAGEAPSTTSQR